MKIELQHIIKQALSDLQQSGKLALESVPVVHIERTKDPKNGDFASNIALALAKVAKMNPRQLSQLIVAALPEDVRINKVEIAGPGFINFFLNSDLATDCVRKIIELKQAYGCSTQFAGEKVHIEYVSANPTGPLHVGHGRSAAYGASLSNLLEAVGYQVHREYYVNDAGRQMHILATSVWLRYLELCGIYFDFPRNGYRGEYIKDIARPLYEAYGKQYCHENDAIFANVADDLDEQGNGNKEQHIDDLIHNAKQLLGDDYRRFFDAALDTILDDIREDLTEFGVCYQHWFSEQSLVDEQAFEHAVAILEEKQLLYKKEGAIWFKSTKFGDDKDRVILRANGERTYFANDIAYHMNKLERGFTKVVDVLGADHHGYVPRVRAAMQALSGKADALVAPLIQFVSLFRGSEKVSMSTRSGEFVTLRQLREEVGNDAARFFYVMRKADQAMDFDLELATSKSNENPVYYIQYAHARVCSVFRQLNEKNIAWQVGEGLEHLDQLSSDAEKQLMKSLARYPEVVLGAASYYEPHQLIHFLRQLANEFHSYYNSHQFIVEQQALREARLNLIAAVKQLLHNGLTLLGVSSPEVM